MIDINTPPMLKSLSIEGDTTDESLHLKLVYEVVQFRPRWERIQLIGSQAGILSARIHTTEGALEPKLPDTAPAAESIGDAVIVVDNGVHYALSKVVGRHRILVNALLPLQGKAKSSVEIPRLPRVPSTKLSLTITNPSPSRVRFACSGVRGEISHPSPKHAPRMLLSNSSQFSNTWNGPFLQISITPCLNCEETRKSRAEALVDSIVPPSGNEWDRITEGVGQRTTRDMSPYRHFP